MAISKKLQEIQVRSKVIELGEQKAFPIGCPRDDLKNPTAVKTFAVVVVKCMVRFTSHILFIDFQN